MERLTLSPVTSVALALASAALLFGACEGRTPSPESWFADGTAALGLDFKYESGATGNLYLPEIMGAGVGLFDYDGDGDLDLYLLNGNESPVTGGVGKHRNQLYRQDAGGRFVDVTEESGLGDTSYGMGLAVGDIDNDGDRDVYVTNYGADRLYLNLGDGTFQDITKSSGIDVPGWSCSAAFVDYDRNGTLDLYVTQYVEHNPKTKCTDPAGRPDYCSPKSYPPATDLLWHNDGNLAFTNVTARSGIAAGRAAGLGVVCEDLNGDGWVDIYVANDGYENHLWVNNKDGTFRDDALALGTALNMHGRAEAGMGVIAADLDGDEDLDLFVAHLASESNTLYLNRGEDRGFDDATGRCGLAASSTTYTGFGTVAIDAELDGDLDLLIVGGRVARSAPPPDAVVPSPWDRYVEGNLLYLNEGRARFTLRNDLAGTLASAREITRGLATGDLDSDGDLDVVINNIESSPRLYTNEAPRQGNWLIVSAVDPALKRSALGAQVTVVTETHRFLRTINAAHSYLSSSDPRAHFGLGAAQTIAGIDVRWPDGLRERFQVEGKNRVVELRRGQGTEL